MNLVGRFAVVKKIDIAARYFFWVVCFFALGYLMFFYIPRQGFDFTDRGYVLYNAMLLARGVVPAVGFAPVVNALFVRFIRNYYFFEILYVAILTGGVILLWYSLEKKNIFKSLCLPFIIIASISYSTHSFIDYQGAPVLYLLYGAGCLFMAFSIDNLWRRRFCLIIAAMVLNLSLFANVSLLPIWPFALLGTFFLLWRGKGRYLYLVSFVLFGLILFALYLQSPLSLFGAQFSHMHSSANLFNRFFDILFVFFYVLTAPAMLFFFGLGLLIRLCCSKNKKFLKRENLFLKITMALALISLLFLLSNPHFVKHGFSGRQFSLSYFWALYHSFYPTTMVSIPKLSYMQWLFFDSAMVLFYVFLTTFVFSLFRRKPNVNLIVLSCIVIGYAIGLAVTTSSSFISHISYVFPAVLLITYFVINTYCDERSIFNYLLNALFLAALIITACFGLFLHSFYVYRSYPPFSPKIHIREGELSGLYVNQAKLQSVRKIQQLYKQYRCEHRYFLAYPSLPLLYWLFNRRAPFNQPWLSPTVGLAVTPESLIYFLSSKKSWCVVNAVSFNGSKDDYFRKVSRFLSLHSATVRKIKINNLPSVLRSYYPDEIIFYVK